MTAVLRKSVVVPLLGALLVVCGGAALGQEVQTNSYMLPGAASMVEACTLFTDPGQLLTLLEAAGTGGYLTDEQAISILTAAGVPSLGEGDPERAEVVQLALVMVLTAVNAGSIDPAGAVTALTVAMAEEAPLEALAALLDEAQSPPGVLNAIWNAALKAGYVQSDSGVLFAEVEIAISAGVPPGIVVRVAKDALRLGLSPGEQIALVMALLEEEGTSPGQAANEATGKGKKDDAAGATGKPEKPKKGNK